MAVKQDARQVQVEGARYAGAEGSGEITGSWKSPEGDYKGSGDGRSPRLRTVLL